MDPAGTRKPTAVIGITVGSKAHVGLGNRLFQMAMVYAYAKKHAIAFRFEDEYSQSEHSQQNYAWLIDRFKTEVPQGMYHHEVVQYDGVYREPGDLFCSFLSLNFGKISVLCEGLYQHESYFENAIDDLRRLMREPEDIARKLDSVSIFHPTVACRSIFIHIRLGDYVNNPKHFVNLTKYYLACMSIAKSKYGGDISFIVFSNQPNRIPEVYPTVWNFLLQTSNTNTKVHVVHDPDEVLNLYAMARCQLGGICSNSTYAWWGGWLNSNPDKTVYMPTKWINMNVPVDILPRWCTRVDVEDA